MSQTFGSVFLAVLAFLWIFGIIFYNSLSLSITKYIDAVARALSDASQTIFIWLIGFIITLTAGRGL